MAIIFSITGRSDCCQSAHALHVAEQLAKFLPSFKYKCQLMPEENWKAYLESQNTEHGWHHTTSPLIWKELTRMGGKPYIIGGLSEFWEYCFDYYGFQSRLSQAQIKQIMAENSYIKSKQEEKTVFQCFSIVGASHPITNFLLVEFQNFFDVENHMQLTVNLFDEVTQSDPDFMEGFLASLEEVQPFLKWEPKNLKIVPSLSEAIAECDILFIVTDYSQLEDESEEEWLHRCMTSMLILSEEINMNGKRSLRVILCHNGPVCFNGSILTENCSTIRLANIVAITADEGISTLDLLAQKTELSLEQMGCPPVWGFTGYNSYVDLGSTIIKCEVYRPFGRAAKAKETSVLPKGRMKYELRVLSYVLEDEEACRKQLKIRKKREMTLLSRPPMLAKVRAVASLLRLWSGKQKHDNIISLGVCSNGSFGFPSGVVLSQPVFLNEKHIWEPLSNFPVSQVTKKKLSQMLERIDQILDKFNLGYRETNSPSVTVISPIEH